MLESRGQNSSVHPVKTGKPLILLEDESDTLLGNATTLTHRWPRPRYPEPRQAPQVRPDLKNPGGVQGLRADIDEILTRTNSALSRCRMLLGGSGAPEGSDTERDLHHLTARIEAMYRQWDDISLVLDRIQSRL